MKRFLSYCVLFLCALAPSAAYAFSEPILFSESTLSGGGGGRFFTGSPVDGYSCAVCHRGGPSPFVKVIGLPVQGYDAGVTYQIELQWDEPTISHALTLELVKLNGQAAGEVALAPPAQVNASGRCEQSAMGEVAAYLVKSPTRSIIGVRDCGAANLRFSFTAPADDEIAFAATIVRSDGSDTVEGDGVLELSKVLLRRGSVTSSRGVTSCAIAAVGRPVSYGWLLLTLGACLGDGLLRRRRKPRANARTARNVRRVEHGFPGVRPLE